MQMNDIGHSHHGASQHFLDNGIRVTHSFYGILDAEADIEDIFQLPVQK